MACEFGEQSDFWRPNSRRLVVPGRSNHETPLSREGNDSRMKLTMYERTNAAIEEFWEERAQRLTARDGRQLQSNDEKMPFENGTMENANTRCNIILGQDYSFCTPERQEITRDLEEKEHARTRGIPGYTGTQPPPDKVRPWKPGEDDDPSKTYAINAFDGRRPRVRGISGYTGHQPAQCRSRHDEQTCSSGGKDQHKVRFIDDGQEMMNGCKMKTHVEETSTLQTQEQEEYLEEFHTSTSSSHDTQTVGIPLKQNLEEGQNEPAVGVQTNRTIHKTSKDTAHGPDRVSSSRFPIRMHVGF